MKDEDYMQLAINIAKVGIGQTNPNPVVGAVIVNDGQVIGIGAHLKAGEAHAEVHALQMAGDKAKNSTIYVTLEPCSHFGKTPPCADLLIKSKVKRVVIGTTDPNPQVSGKGIKKLREAGIEVDLGIMKLQADELNPVYYHYMDTGMPYVTLKSAISLDGKIATSTGESKWITGERARLDVHMYRQIHDAILVGVNTVITDNPSLTTRLPNGNSRNPIRVILDSSLRTPLHSNVIQDDLASTWIIVNKSVKQEKMKPFIEKGIRIIPIQDDIRSIKNVLKLLVENGISSVFVEGGAEINGSFLKERAINQVLTYIAPKLIGGKRAPTSIGGNGIEHMADVFQLSVKSVEQLGDDIKIVSEPIRLG
ncbi:bifunctional diaminohydroxyphosphoribosylaminopyrimidine deaminase/5-amino-6-(5-phosphoribosylamino)uracil reductase RibD [Fredinandcohnia quinoae]|uniref:Riboflavin biosynthesis protein RibD n=1 Tax=Fredinandcohnia quinoae TaxID=2918902 RepID=A0AAW5DVZ3_9BACI|nr:bifunctional diaminohydroxyphosphoribosylaminopyrimidine deaminase/5-amino-6-(5-phosphoribosylamino)uracil reductase RibD [Fredinandcohnia sp. SECRCQ15]MCH1624810.1 bifunctional diaminohydroxyphosphoribosylaminopyrimidine deaminase/5-amino-6-(5-phosphoribosylamino)uracil reductase RibD [Fredinandcohnia sp. SECRCQ15]